MTYNRQEQLRKIHEERKAKSRKAALLAIDRLEQQGKRITFSGVAEEAGLATSTLYNNTELKARIVNARQSPNPQTSEKKAITAETALVQSLRRTINKLKSENQQLRRQINTLQEQQWREL